MEGSLGLPGSSPQGGSDLREVQVVRQPQVDLRQGYREDVEKAFSKRPYTLPTKYLYDREGSLLFEKFAAASPQYYPYVETALISSHAEQLRSLLAVRQIVELGAGSCPRLPQLLDLDLLTSGTEYHALDVSPTPLLDNLVALALRYPQLRAKACIGDFETWQPKEYADTEASTVVLWLGNTAANSSPEHLVQTLNWITKSFPQRPDLILGISLEGPRPDVEERFPDTGGFFSRFRWHALTRLNEALGADFHPNNFSLRLAYNKELNQAESFFVPTSEHSVMIGDLSLSVDFKTTDRLIVGVTRDYTPKALGELLSPSQWRIENIFGSSASGYALVHIKSTGHFSFAPRKVATR
jgi:L-histidine N-alpha-methyltransferase